MIDPITRAAFADELTKIAAVNWAPAKQVFREGLIGSPDQGKIWRGIGVGMNALQLHQGLKSSLSREDPSGHGHSRAERLMGFAGEFGGGVLASGLAQRALHAAKAPGWVNLLGSATAGLAGSLGARRIATMPFALKRKLFNRNPAPQQMLPQHNEGSNNVAPGGVHSPDAITGQAQAM